MILVLIELSILITPLDFHYLIESDQFSKTPRPRTVPLCSWVRHTIPIYMWQFLSGKTQCSQIFFDFSDFPISLKYKVGHGVSSL
jgi:hypothetical protein